LIVPLLLWFALLIARAAWALRQNRQSYPAGIFRNSLRLLLIVPIIATLDAAAFAGTISWFLSDKLHLALLRHVRPTMTLAHRRVLYISYNGMLDPLGQSQVIPYLKELSRAGVSLTLLSFEGAELTRPRDASDASSCEQS